jgi:hypothetical protein
MEFRKNGKSIFINKKIGESEDMFFDKGWFLVSQDLSKYNTLEDLIKIGEIYINTKYKGCIYDINLMNLIKSLTNDIYDD